MLSYLSLHITCNVSVIFNWIQFRNDVCHAKSYNTEDHEYDEDGVCYTSGECSSRGGLHKANCAAGYGACCVCKITILQLFNAFKYIFYIDKAWKNIKFLCYSSSIWQWRKQ